MLFKDKNLKPTEKMKKDVVDEVLGNPKIFNHSYYTQFLK